MNPPYGKDIGEWTMKAREESEKGCLVVGLLPARTDTKWWHESVEGFADICFIKGRLHYNESRNAAPFGSAIAIWWGKNIIQRRS